MRDVWDWAISWFYKPPSSWEKRVKQKILVEAIKTELSIVSEIPLLHNLFCSDSRWSLLLVREFFPKDWPTLSIHATTAAAYGLRFVELMTGKELDARKPLPIWVREWTIW